MGLLLMGFACAGMLLSGYAYMIGRIPAVLCIVIVALMTSIFHEMEHDMIHGIFFRKKKITTQLMFTLIHILRPNVSNPWFRKKIHLQHHRGSADLNDLEELDTGVGLRWGFKRILCMLDPVFAPFLRRKVFKNIRAPFKTDLFTLMLNTLPLHVVYIAAWGAWNASHFFAPQFLPSLNTLAVIYLAPNLLRYFCYAFMAANIHYLKHQGGVLEEVMILNVWWLAPVQLFCWNFGATHAIHHIAPQQPFYIRTLIGKQVIRFFNFIQFTSVSDQWF